MKKAKLFFEFIAIALFVNYSAYGQLKCLYLVGSLPLTPGDQIINDKLVDFGYEVTPTPSAELGFLFIEEITAFDFAFASESCGSGDFGTDDFKTIPIPLANMEGFAAKPGALDWQTVRDGDDYPTEPIKIVDNTGHPLSAEFTAGSTVTLCTEGSIIGFTPEIPIISIGVMSSDESKQVIYGVEAGTQNLVGDTILNRVATVGIHTEGYLTLTDDAWKLIKAAIDWILPATTVEENEQFIPTGFKLAQNFPNPFNPLTTIEYQLSEKTGILLKVFNVDGHEVASLVNDVQAQGQYRVMFDGRDLASGIYIYRLITNDHMLSKRMLMIK